MIKRMNQDQWDNVVMELLGDNDGNNIEVLEAVNYVGIINTEVSTVLLSYELNKGWMYVDNTFRDEVLNGYGYSNELKQLLK